MPQIKIEAVNRTPNNLKTRVNNEKSRQPLALSKNVKNILTQSAEWALIHNDKNRKYIQRATSMQKKTAAYTRGRHLYLRENYIFV